jgi:multiple sugar transport system substrate-binding protein
MLLRPAPAGIAVLATGSLLLAACGGGGSGSSSGPPTLNWYVNPNSSGSYQKIANYCVQNSGGRYKVALQVLPATADGQREQIIRRLAAKDSSMDVVAVDPPYTPEVANAGWARAFSASERADLLADVLQAPQLTAVWKGRLVAVPWQANTQLLWYKKSVAKKAGIDPQSPTFTWDQLIDGASKIGSKVEEQGDRYEGYAVWVNAMVLGAGGQVLTNNDKGKDATVTLDSAAGRRAAQLLLKFATSKAADPSLATAEEAQGLAAFETDAAGFMLNWPYVYAAFKTAMKAGTVKPSFLGDVAWARYPRVDAKIRSAPPSGGINLVISNFSTHVAEDLAFVTCVVSPEAEKIELLVNGDPMANSKVYDDPEVVKSLPMAALIKQSINDAGPRAITPFYGDVSAAIQRTWHPASNINPQKTPAESASLLQAVLHDRRLL